MSVAARLRGAFAVYIALLGAVVIYHARTIERSVESGHALTEISSRLREGSTDQLTRIAQMSGDAEKFLVTRDPGYREKFNESAVEFGRTLRHLDSIPVTENERAALLPLMRDWSRVEATHLAAVETASPAAARDSVSALLQTLELVRSGTQAVSAASQDAMSRELDESERAARSAERVSWAAALGALILSGVLSAVLVRSIVGPLERLAHGTREVSAGRFGHRLEASGSDELSQVARDFNAMTERLDDLDRMKRDFVAKVSHDLKTPLSSMQETINVILDGVAGPVTPKQRQLLALNLDGGKRLAAMLGKLLDLSRIEAGLEPDLQLLDTVQLVRQSMERADAARTDHSYRLILVDPDRRVLVRADAEGITQVMDNLIENAIKFSPPQGTVQLRVAEWAGGADDVSPQRASSVVRRGLGGGAVLITVADEGPGIPDEEKEKVFSRFYQAEAGRAARGRGGVGLGLTICREIVDAHGGQLWVSDNEPRGSVFSVLLPGAVAAPDAHAASAPIASAMRL